MSTYECEKGKLCDARYSMSSDRLSKLLIRRRGWIISITSIHTLSHLSTFITQRQFSHTPAHACRRFIISISCSAAIVSFWEGFHTLSHNARASNYNHLQHASLHTSHTHMTIPLPTRPPWCLIWKQESLFVDQLVNSKRRPVSVNDDSKKKGCELKQRQH